KKLGTGFRQAWVGSGLGSMHVQMTRAGVLDVPFQHAGKYAMQPDDIRIVEVASATSLFQQEQRITIERDDVEVVGIFGGQLLHGGGIGTLLFHPALGDKVG